MTFRINDKVMGGIFIEGREFPLEVGNFMQSLHINASSLTKLPVINLHLVDIANLMPKFDLQDGALIRVVLNGSQDTSREFRVFNWKRSPVGNGFAYSINGYYNSVKYWAGTTNSGIKASSSGALDEIARICGLQTYERNTRTADVMTWQGSNMTYSAFARDIARRGYVNDKSHMMLAVDSMGYMRYINVNANLEPNVTLSYSRPEGVTNFVTIIDFKPTTRSGLNNALGGYKHRRFVQSADINARIDALEDKLTFEPDAERPLLNQRIRTAIEASGISHSPIDFGNVHPDYERARYQNVRFNLLNSLTGEFLIPLQTPFEPGDNFSFVQVEALKSSEYNGEWTVQSKIIFVTGSTYNEKLVAVKNGLSGKGNERGEV